MQSAFTRLGTSLLRHRIVSRHVFRRRVATEAEVKTKSQVERIEARLPRFLRRFVTPLRTAPVSHITAFILLHELTAVIPLFALAGFFHYTHWLPPFLAEGRIFQEGTERFGKWLRKRGWIDAKDDFKSKWYGRSEGGVRVVVELATAYTITKFLLPVRIPLSIWLTPWFARWTILPARNVIARLFGSRKQTAAVTTSSTAPAGVPVKPIQLPAKKSD